MFINIYFIERLWWLLLLVFIDGYGSAVVAEARQFFSNVFYLKIKDLISSWIYDNISLIFGQTFHGIDLMLVYGIYSWCYVWSS